MTKAHNDRIIKDGSDKGYSIRVGKTLPINSANLAYVSTPKMGPEKNLQIIDLSGNIKENGLPSTYQTERIMYPGDNYLLSELSGESKLPSKKVAVTDEFSIPATTQDSPVPLYYSGQTKGNFDAKGALVTPYIGGYMAAPPDDVVDYAKVDPSEQDDLLYLGNKIKITNLDGTSIKSAYKYKIRLIQQTGSNLPQNSYKINYYTNFKPSKDETFLIRYELYSQDGKHTADYTEIINVGSTFNEVSKGELDVIINQENNLTMKGYAVKETSDNNYEVYAGAKVMVADNTTRPAHQFKYRVKGNLQTRLSRVNTGTINIGIAYLNTSVINVEDLSGTLKKVFENEFKPPYLDFVNPYPPQKSYLKENPQYWEVDLAMPVERWYEYDLVIITGYGYYDMSPYGDSIRSYLQNGGKLWIDNAGEVGKTLSFTSSTGIETFVTNIGFSNTTAVAGFKAENPSDDTNELLNRLYMLGGQDQITLGYNNGLTGADNVQTNPQITFGSSESQNNWNTIVRYSSGQPSVMVSKSISGTFLEKGRILISNCGIFRSLFHGKENDTKLAMNIILSFAENKLILGPWQQEYVYHRDNLFKEEYIGANGTTIYVDERNDFDASQIVAKKIINRSTKSALLPYVSSQFFTARGVYEVEVESNTEIPVSNGSMESGTYDSANKVAVTQWTASTTAAIPGWDTVHLAGDATTFSHVDSASERGAKAIQINVATSGNGSQAFWKNTSTLLVSGSYRATAWMKVTNVAGKGARGATIGIYNSDGTQIAIGSAIIGSHDWVKVDVDFSITTAKQVDMRIGFVDGNGEGTILIDYLILNSVGSVYMTPSTDADPNDGSKALYAYAVKPRGESFDLRAEGYTTADITTYDPAINVDYTIRSYVYAWDNYAGKKMKVLGNYVTYSKTIRRSDGIVNLGTLTTMLPALNAGSDWADVNDIYYEIYLGGNDGADSDSNFVNLEIYDTSTGKYYFNKDGAVVIKYMDLFYGGENKNVLLQARTNYYTIRATKRRFGVLVQPENKIQLAYPSTIDERKSWFLRVQNGSFVKKELGYNDIQDLLAYDNRYYEFQQRLFGTHYYSMPEFNRQVFKPLTGYKRVRQETAEYINDNTIKVQNAPLYVVIGSSLQERLSKVGTSGLVYKAQNAEWDKSSAHIYVDENMDGTVVEWLDGFDIDYTNGVVTFESAPAGYIYADYDYNNLEIWKRSYNNLLVRDEEVGSIDGKTFASKHKNWLQFPTPTVKVSSYLNDEQKIVPVTSYTIDYHAGAVIFKEDMTDRVTVSYSYSTDKPLVVRDFDIQNGYIYLADSISFKDEIYVNYYYQENYLEYRGYYNNEAKVFVYLDLNPSEGHYCTMPIPRTDSATGESFTSWEHVPTSKLLNKEVYIYLLPYTDSFGNYNEDTVHHCYSLGEWQTIQKTNPAAMLLGIIHIREHTNIKEAVVMDTRSRGGGLKETIKESQMNKTQPLSKNYWDMATWDGDAYYKNGVLIISLPKKILQSEGGQFTEKQVRDIVGKYIAYGIYFIVEFA